MIILAWAIALTKETGFLASARKKPGFLTVSLLKNQSYRRNPVSDSSRRNPVSFQLSQKPNFWVKGEGKIGCDRALPIYIQQ